MAINVLIGRVTSTSKTIATDGHGVHRAIIGVVLKRPRTYLKAFIVLLK